MVTLGGATPFITNNITPKRGGCHAHFKVDQHEDSKPNRVEAEQSNDLIIQNERRVHWRSITFFTRFSVLAQINVLTPAFPSSECLTLTDPIQAKKERPPDDETDFIFLTHKNKFPTLRLVRGKFLSNNQLPWDQKNIIIPLN